MGHPTYSYQQYKLSAATGDWLRRGHFFSFRQLKIFYRDEGTGPCLLVVHGYPYSGFDFVELLPELALHFRVVIPDMPGMGFSDKPKNHTYTFEEMADLYTAVVHEFKLGAVTILAHDLGNSVVQELLARDLENKNQFAIRRVAFLNGGLFADVYRPRLLQVLLSKSPPPVGRLISNMLTRQMVAKATAAVFGENTKPSLSLLKCFWEILNYNQGKSIAYQLGRLIFEKEKYQQRWIAAMQETTIPLCFINGPADPNSGMHMVERYRELIPNPETRLLSPAIGHWPQLEAPAETLAVFFSFLAACDDADAGNTAVAADVSNLPR